MARSVSLYIHIPFCKSKCAYCDFFSQPCNTKTDDSIIPDSYIDALCIEAKFYAKNYGITSWKTVYIGGGTPSLMTPSQLRHLIPGIKNAVPLAENAEVTIEMNPDDITEELLEAAKESGVNRLSVGIQSLSDKVLKACGRRCTRKTSLEALNLIHKNWQGKFSADLISALPFDDKNQLQKSIEEIIGFNPDHISLYSLTLEEKTPLGKAVFEGKIHYDFEKADELWLFGRNLLEKNGYKQYEVSNFAKPGFESEHNKTYWHLEDYIGLGAGAAGTVYSDCSAPQEASSGIRWNNSHDINSYIDFWNSHRFLETDRDNISAEQKIPAEIETLDLKTQEFEYLMMGFRLLEGINESKYRLRFGKNLKSRLGADKDSGLFNQWQKNGLAHSYTKNGDIYYGLTKKGILLFNQFLENLIL